METKNIMNEEIEFSLHAYTVNIYIMSNIILYLMKNSLKCWSYEGYTVNILNLRVIQDKVKKDKREEMLEKIILHRVIMVVPLILIAQMMLSR